MADPHVVLRTVVATAKRVRAAGGRLDEHQDPPLRILRRDLLDEWRDGRGHLLPAAGLDHALNLFQAAGGESDPRQGRKVVLVPGLSHTADDVRACW